MRLCRSILCCILFCCVAACLWGYPRTATAQTVLYSVAAAADELTAGLHHFGFRDDAATGVDTFDIPEPPAPPEAYLSLALIMTGPAPPVPNRWRADIRNSQVFVDKVELWELHIETDRIGSTCTLDFDVEEGAQFNLKLQIIGLEANPIVVPVPGQVSFPLTKPFQVIWLELTSDEPIAATSRSWGHLKENYR